MHTGRSHRLRRLPSTIGLAVQSDSRLGKGECGAERWDPPFQVAGFASKGPLALSVWVGGFRSGPVAGQAPRGSRATPSFCHSVSPTSRYLTYLPLYPTPLFLSFQAASSNLPSLRGVWHRHIVMSCLVCTQLFASVQDGLPREASIADIKELKSTS